jgi:hypothetical protein
MSTNADILQRTKDECKDSTNAYAPQRQNFIGDICREITTTTNFRWLEVADELPYVDTWVPLPEEVGRLMAVGVGGQPLTPISESEYFKRKYALMQNAIGNNKGYYRFRWNKEDKVFEILPINVDNDTTLDILYRRFLSTPDEFPDYFDEAIVCGVLWKFMAMLEGDDLDAATFQKTRYIEIVKQLELLWNPDVQSDENTRIMTQDEIDSLNSFQYYDRP